MLRSQGLFPAGLPVKILKELLPSSILVTCSAYLNLLDLIILANVKNYEVRYCGAHSTTHSHTSWAQKFASGSCQQISFACIPYLV